MIYVDSTQFYPHSSLFPPYWCHLFTDGDVRSLHAFAARLGLDRTWFLNNPVIPYYDVVPAKRKLAIALGAKEISKKQLKALFMLQKRRSEERASSCTIAK